MQRITAICRLISAGILIIIALAGCQSGDISRRDDFSSAAFDAQHTRRADRANFHQAVDPEITDSEAHRLASDEFKAARKKEKQQRRAAQVQDQFEEELSELFGE